MMRKARALAVGRLLGLLLLAGILAGCFGRDGGACAKPREYQASRSVQSLEVPEDLDAPPQLGLEIPEVPPSSEEQGEKEPTCLDDPPDYFGR